jgi:ABC-type transporter MlaC component
VENGGLDMRRLVRSGLLICGALVFLALLSSAPAIAEQSGKPVAKTTKPALARPRPQAHATHAKLAVKTVAAARHKPEHKRLASGARPVARKPVVHPHHIAVARKSAPAHRRPPVVLVNARPAPPEKTVGEKAEADRLAASLYHPAPAVAVPSASDFVTTFLNEAFRIARTVDEAPDQRRADLANLMTTRMDLSRILVYATHAAYQAAPPEMQAQFRQSFASFLAEAYTPRIRLAAELQFTAGPARPSQDGGITVPTIFTKPGIAESTIDWQLEPSGNSYKIVDVGSQGVSLLQIQRSSFTSVMANDGGLQGLLSKMDARTRELASAAK